MTAANLPLADIRVLEIGHIIAGPSGGLVRSNLGPTGDGKGAGGHHRHERRG